MMSHEVDLAIVGAAGLEGEALVELLSEREFPVGALYLLDSGEGVGNKREYNGKYYPITDVADFDFSQARLVIICSDKALAAAIIPQATQAGCVVVDGSSYAARDEQVPLILPGVNDLEVGDLSLYPVIACPSPITSILWLVLKPIYDAVGISQLNVSTYEAVTGMGKGAMEELATQTVSLLNMREVETHHFPRQMAFNTLPEVGHLQLDGYSEGESQLIAESQKLMADDQMVVVPTAVRVPVFFGHSLAVHLETQHALSATGAVGLLQGITGIEITDQEETAEYPTAVTDAKDQDSVFVGRIRQHPTHKNSLSLWIVADNIRRGTALTSLQVAEILVKGCI
jgi:aspartate-semialdehyde dehydrogenase